MNLARSSSAFTVPVDLLGAPWVSEAAPDLASKYYRARYYDPRAGRFVSEDPIGFEAGANFYSYVLGSPTIYRDPYGLDITVIENGPTKGNPIGHTAVGISGHGVFSYGNSTPQGLDIGDYLLREAPRRDTTVYVIPTTPEQDAAAFAAIVKDQNLGVFTDNCSSRSNDILDAAGFPRPNPNPMLIDNGPMPFLPDLPGSAGQRAKAAGARQFVIPKGTKVLPPELKVLIR